MHLQTAHSKKFRATTDEMVKSQKLIAPSPFRSRRSDVRTIGRDPHHSPDRMVHMELKRSGSQPSAKGPAEYFTGAVRIDPLFRAPDPARVVCSSVPFEPGAGQGRSRPSRSGSGPAGACAMRSARRGGPIEDIRPGDVVWVPPGEKHRHGAAATTAMTHMAIQEHLDGKTADWLEKVSDEQYQAGHNRR